MKLLVLLLGLGVVVARPSVNHVAYSSDGRSYSYSYQTPFLQTLVPAARYIQTVPSSVVVGPAVRYSIAPIAVKNVEPANIQLSSDGFVLDTPEVAAAKADHLAAVEQERARGGFSDGVEESEAVEQTDDEAVEVAAAPENTIRAVYEPANIQISADGHVLDTPEVAQAKAEHFATFAAEAARSSHIVGYSAPSYAAYNYIQPIAAPAVVRTVIPADIRISADGHVLDTPEVAQAKALHFAQYAEEAARSAAAGGDSGSYDDESESVDATSIAGAPIVAATPFIVPGVKRVDDPPADIRISSDGFVMDTPEVAQAKAVHLQELAKVGSTDDDSQSDTDGAAVVAYSAPIAHQSYVAYTSPSVAYTAVPVAYAQPRWIGPEADIKVNSEGFVEDTAEVKQARAEHLATRASIMANTQAESSLAGATVRYASGHFIPFTPEVAAARAAHLAAYAKEAAVATASVNTQTQTYGQLVYNTPVFRTVVPHFGYSALPYSHGYRLLNFRYAPVAPVALTPDGQYLLDTPEVAAEKARHFAAHAQIKGL